MRRWIGFPRCDAISVNLVRLMTTSRLSAMVPSSRFLLTAWFAAGVMLFILIGDRDVARAQEARVLETARQMIDADWHGWLVPQLNGEPRLRKPPLCYWYTAAAFKMFGVSETVGRLPTMLIGWIAILVTFFLGRDIAGSRPASGRDIQRGFFAAAALASSFFFIRFTRSAETDMPTLLGAVVAVWAIIRSLGGSKAWLFLAAIGISFSAMTKGPPAIYPVLFLVAISIARRTFKPVVSFVTTGAVAVALALSLAWWLTVLLDPAGRQVEQELAVIATGANHPGWFYEYVPILLLALLPWTPFYLAGFVVGLFDWKKDATFRTIVIAIMSVFVPLAITPQVQPHYLLPMLPFCAVLVGWIIVRMLEGELDARMMRIMRWIFIVTVLLFLVGGPAALASAYAIRKSVNAIDVVAAVALFASGLMMLTAFRRRRADVQLAAWASAMLMVMPIIAGWWAPSLAGYRSREMAREVTYFYGDRPMMMFGPDSNITLSFNLRRTLLRTGDADVLRRFIEAAPDGVVVIERDRRKPSATPLPDVLEESRTFRIGDEMVEFYTRIGQSLMPNGR